MLPRISFLAFALCAMTGCDLFKEPTKKVAAGAAPEAAKEVAPPQMEQVKAGVGVGKKGASLRGDDVNKVIAAPAIGFFAAKEKIVFEIEIPKNLEIYRALNPDGNYPKTHEEFMEKVIKEYQVKLPELPQGHRYVYDPESHTLMVERPAGTAPKE